MQKIPVEVFPSRLDAATKLDFPVVMGITMILTIMILIANLIVDISYMYIDPRIRLD